MATVTNQCNASKTVADLPLNFKMFKLSDCC